MEAVIESYQRLEAISGAIPTEQAAVAQADFDVLSGALSNPALPPHIQLKALSVVARHSPQFEDKAQDVITNFLNIIGSESVNAAVQLAAVRSISALSTNTMVIREVADVLLQIAMPQSTYSAELKHAAQAAIDQLATTNALALALKLLHWMSDVREAEADEVLVAERAFALEHFAKLKGKLKEEDEQNVLDVAQSVLPSCSRVEYRVLLSGLADMKICKGEGVSKLVDLVMGSVSEDTLDKSLDTITELGPHLPTTASFPSVMEPLLGMLGAGPVAFSVTKLKVLKAASAAALVCTEEQAKALVPVVQATLEAEIPDDSLPTNLTFVEANLVLLTRLGKKDSISVLAVVKNEAMLSKFRALKAQIEAIFSTLNYALKKKTIERTATAAEQEAQQCVRSLKSYVEALCEGHLPKNTAHPSWFRNYKDKENVAAAQE